MAEAVTCHAAYCKKFTKVRSGWLDLCSCLFDPQCFTSARSQIDQEGFFMKSMSLNRLGAVVISLGLLPAAFVSAHAVPVTTEFTSGADRGPSYYVGQSFTTASGGPFDHITFNFFSGIGGGMTPSAAGRLFLLS